MASDTFIGKCIAGKAKPEDIDYYIEKWGASNTPTPLYQYLGMSWEEFEGWMLHAEELENIIDSKRKHKRRKENV